MTIFPGKVVNGHVEVELDDPADLPEGAEVSVLLRNDKEYVPTPEEEAELEAAIEEAEQGGGISAEELLRELRAIRDEEIQRPRS